MGYLGTDFTPTDDPLTMTNHPYNHPTPPQTKIEVRNFQDMFYFIICLSFSLFHIYIYNHMAFASPSCTSISKRCAQGQRVLEIVQRVGCPTCSLMSSKLHSNMWHTNIYIYIYVNFLFIAPWFVFFLSQYDNNISLYIIVTYYSNDMIILIVTYRMYRSCLAPDI